MRTRGTLVVMAALLLARAAPAQELEGKGKTLHLMHIQTADVTLKAVAAAVARFEAATGASVVVEPLKNDQFKQKLSVVLGSDSPPDVFHTWGGGVLAGQVRDGLVAPVPDTIPATDINPRALEFCTVDGRLYALPTDISIVAFWYRKSLFAKHGISPPATLGELYAACAKFKEAGVAPISLGNIEHWPGAFFFDYMVIRQGGAQDYISASNRAGAPAQTAATFLAQAFIRSLTEMGVFNDGFRGLDYGQSRTVFFEGGAAMTLMGSWLLSFAMSDRPDVVADLGIFAFPALDSGPHSKALLGGVNAAYAISARSKNKDLAAQLLQFLTDETAAAEWAKTGRIPARKVPADEALPVLADASRMLADAPAIQLYFDQALDAAVAGKHKAWTQSLFITASATVGRSGATRWVVGVVAGVCLLALVLVLRVAFRSGG